MEYRLKLAFYNIFTFFVDLLFDKGFVSPFIIANPHYLGPILFKNPSIRFNLHEPLR